MKKIYLPLLSVILGLMMTACNAVWQDEPVCNQGLSIRFIYSYNMEYANAFPSQVHCLTVLIVGSVPLMQARILQATTCQNSILSCITAP